MDADALIFFEKRPDGLEIYRALTALMEQSLPPFTCRVQRTQISFYNRHLFASVSLPRRVRERGLTLSLYLARRLDSPRVGTCCEPYPGRLTHHLPIADAAQLDGELMEWMRECYEFAMSKR